VGRHGGGRSARQPKLAQSQGFPLELPLLVSHETRKGATVSAMSKLCHRTTYSDAAVRCTAFGPRLLPVYAMQHERQWTSRYTVGIPASRALPGGYPAQRRLRTLQKRLRRQVRKEVKNAKHRIIRLSPSLPLPSCTRSRKPLRSSIALSRGIKRR
jgi:hypothetical protein